MPQFYSIEHFIWLWYLYYVFSDRNSFFHRFYSVGEEVLFDFLNFSFPAWVFFSDSIFCFLEMIWAHHKIWQNPQRVESEREDRSLQVICSRTEDETGNFEMKGRKKSRDHLLVSQASMASRWRGPLGIISDDWHKQMGKRRSGLPHNLLFWTHIRCEPVKPHLLRIWLSKWLSESGNKNHLFPLEG